MSDENPKNEVMRLQKEMPAFFEASNSKKNPAAQLQAVRERIKKADTAWKDKYNMYIADFEHAMQFEIERPIDVRHATHMLAAMREEHAALTIVILYDKFKDRYSPQFVSEAFNKHGFKGKALKKDAYTQVLKWLNDREEFVENAKKYSPNSKNRRLKAYNDFGPSSMAMTKTLNATISKKVKKDEWKAIKAKMIAENSRLIEKNFPEAAPPRFSEETLRKKLETAVRKSIARTKKADKPKIKEEWAQRLLNEFDAYKDLDDFKKILKFASVRGTYDALKARMQAKFDKVVSRSTRKASAEKISTAIHKFFNLEKKSKCFTVKLSCAEKITREKVMSFERALDNDVNSNYFKK